MLKDNFFFGYLQTNFAYATECKYTACVIPVCQQTKEFSNFILV